MIFSLLATIRIEHPLYAYCAMAHPGDIINNVDTEKKNTESSAGLFDRHLINMPRPYFPLADEAEDGNEDDLPSLER